MFANLKAVDYRHYICIAITLGFLGCGFIFPNALPRVAEAIRDLALSFVHYCFDIVNDEYNPISVTVNQMPAWQFAPSRFEPLKLFPWTWEEFKVLWGEYWQTWATWDNVEAYFYFLGDLMYYLSKILPVVPMLFLVVFLKLQQYANVKNNDIGKESKPLIRWKDFSIRYIFPTVKWVKDFVSFIKENETYKNLWVLLWCLYFNVISIVVGALAWYVYFTASFDALSLYTQVLKLMIDLAPMVRFVPVAIWVCVGVWALNAVCRSQAYATLYHCENKNRGYVNERGVVTIVYGNMGVGKTSQLTSMAITEEANLRDDALSIIKECAIMFPKFPWPLFREEIKRKMRAHEIVDVPSIRKWMAELRRTFEWMEDNDGDKWYFRQVKKRGLRDITFGYDFRHYATKYNDGLVIERLYSVLTDYACAYYLYAIQTSLIISNYAIRSDGIQTDLGNMPSWDYDFFKRDPVLMDEYSRFSHILDFDMLRLGKRMLDKNPNRFAFGFGVYVISEIDKERKNMQETKEMRIKDDECNQRNDLFNSHLKMSRHAVVIRNRVFLKFFVDLQRPEDWGAGGRDVGELNYIESKEDLIPALPFFSPFWICEGIFKFFKARYDGFTKGVDVNRADDTLFMYAVRNLMSKLDNHYRKVNNIFGVQVINLELEAGRMDGNVKKKKYYRMPKKDYAARYATNCLNVVFIGDEPNQISIADLKEYSCIMATPEEWKLQNSHFQRDVERMQKAA